jgi:nucleoside-diphosphate-sugar epimerase
VSTIKALGEEREMPYREDDAPMPRSEYGKSKLAAETVLQETVNAQMEVVVVRPPMVYGAVGKGNVSRLARLARVARHIPLPLGSVHNRRSLIFVENLAHAVQTMCDHPRAAGRTFHVSDGVDVSTPDLLRAVARAQDASARPMLFACPTPVLGAAAKLLGLRGEARRLLESLVVDTDRIRQELNWRPPVSFEEGLRRTFGS